MTQHERPDDQSISDALESVLSSAAFARSERLRAFLKYVVEKEIEGAGPQLKGYTIGIDVFDRPQAFNADNDPLVRVHAGKLRKLLTAYYAGEGAEDTWRIDIPKGTYVPEYRRLHVTQAVPAVAAPTRRATLPRRLSWLPAPLSSPLAVLSVLPLLIFVPLSSPAMSVNIPVQSGLHRAAQDRSFAGNLPRVAIRVQTPGSKAADRFAEAVRVAASHYRTVAAVPDTMIRRRPQPTAPEPLAFTISVSQQASPAGLRVAITHDASSDTLHDGFIEHARIAEEADILYESLALAAKTLASDGQIFRYAVAAMIESPLMKCVALTDAYHNEQTREAFQEAKDCQENLSGAHRRKLNFAINVGTPALTSIR